MSGKLRLYKEKLEGYKKFHSIVKTIKMVTLAKYRQAMARTKTRDFTLRYTEKAFGAVKQEEEAHAIANAKSTLLYVPITSNRGSCGALNSNCFKYIDSVMSPQCKLMVIGKKGQDSLNKLHPKEFHYSVINDMKAPMSFGYASFIWANMLTVPNVERYQIYFNRYVSAGTQRQAIYNIPAYEKFVEGLNTAASTEDKRYSFANALLENEEETIRDFYDFHGSLCTLNAVCENELSEQAARLVAVEGQLTNLTQLQSATQSLYNKTRQGAITASLIEILSAMSSLEGNAAKGVQRTNFWEGNSKL
jgi:F-type H+-transporting ATPase subunit gamma